MYWKDIDIHVHACFYSKSILKINFELSSRFVNNHVWRGIPVHAFYCKYILKYSQNLIFKLFLLWIMLEGHWYSCPSFLISSPEWLCATGALHVNMKPLLASWFAINNYLLGLFFITFAARSTLTRVWKGLGGKDIIPILGTP